MINVIENSKEQIKIEIDNITIAEALRTFLWQDESVTLAAWRREHPTKNPVLIVRTKGKSPKKAVLDCVERIQKMNDAVAGDFKKVVKK